MCYLLLKISVKKKKKKKKKTNRFRFRLTIGTPKTLFWTSTKFLWTSFFFKQKHEVITFFVYNRTIFGTCIVKQFNKENLWGNSEKIYTYI